MRSGSFAHIKGNLRRGLFWAATITTACSGLLLSTPAHATPFITEFQTPINTPTSSGFDKPFNIISGPDGNLWYTKNEGNPVEPSNLGTITPSGQVTEHYIPWVQTFDVATGPDGQLWMTVGNSNIITQYNPHTGVSIDHQFPTFGTGFAIARGRDDYMWFTLNDLSKVGIISMDGFIISEFDLPTDDSGPADIAAGFGNSMWIAENKGGNIARIIPGSGTTEFHIPTPNSRPFGLALGPDHNIWFTEEAGKIGKITPEGLITEYDVPSITNAKSNIAAGPDHNMWFTDANSNKIGRISTTGQFTEFAIPTSDAGAYGITAGPDGNMWFTENHSGKIGRLALTGTVDVPEYGPTAAFIAGGTGMAVVALTRRHRRRD